MPSHDSLQEVGAFGSPIDQREHQVGPGLRNDKSGDTASCPEVDHATRHTVESTDHRASMLNRLTYRS